MKFDILKPGEHREKLGIVGFAESSRHLAPFDDPSWEIHAMNQLYRHIPRANVWWECHQREDFLRDQVPGTDYLKWLQECQIPIMMVRQFPDIPNSVRIPIEDWVFEFGDYFYSTISYMIAYGIAGKYKEIGIWGVDLAHDTEYEYQKPSAEYLLGVAKGRGIKVTIAEQSALLRGMYRYGYESMPDNKDIQWLTVYKNRVGQKLSEILGQANQIQGRITAASELGAKPDYLDNLSNELNKTLGIANQLQGQINCAEEFTSWARSKRRGSEPPDPDLPNPDYLAKNEPEYEGTNSPKEETSTPA